MSHDPACREGTRFCSSRQRWMCSSPGGVLETQPVQLSEEPFAAFLGCAAGRLACCDAGRAFSARCCFQPVVPFGVFVGAAMPAALLAASLLVSQMFSLSCARVQNARAVGRTRRARACQVLHGTSPAGSRLSSWTHAMDAKGACSTSECICVLIVLRIRGKVTIPFSPLALACHQRACLLPR